MPELLRPLLSEALLEVTPAPTFDADDTPLLLELTFELAAVVDTVLMTAEFVTVDATGLATLAATELIELDEEDTGFGAAAPADALATDAIDILSPKYRLANAPRFCSATSNTSGAELIRDCPRDVACKHFRNDDDNKGACCSIG
ncbi:MAG: hypothetical protein ABIQ30_14965 [Devosia sp.]